MNEASIQALSVWTGLHVLLMLGLALNVTRNRLKSASSELPAGTLDRVIRAHGNNIEYVPVILFALGLLAFQGLSAMWIHVLGGALFLGRVLHAHGIQVPEGLPPSRVAGNLITWAVMATCGVLLITHFL